MKKRKVLLPPPQNGNRKRLLPPPLQPNRQRTLFGPTNTTVVSTPVQVKRKAPSEQAKRKENTEVDELGKKRTRCRKKAKASRMAPTTSVPPSFRTPDPVVVNDYWVMYALPQKALFRDLLHLSADELVKIDGFDATTPLPPPVVVKCVPPPPPPPPVAPVVDYSDPATNPFFDIDFGDVEVHLRPLTPPREDESCIKPESSNEDVFEGVAELQENDMLRQREMDIVERCQQETVMLRERNQRIKREVMAEDSVVKAEESRASLVAVEDAIHRASATAQSDLFAVAAQRYTVERAVVESNKSHVTKRTFGNEKKAEILSYVERNLNTELRHINNTQKLVLEVEIPKAVEVGGGKDGAIPEDDDSMTAVQRAKLLDFQTRLRPAMDQLKAQSTIKSMITKRVSEIKGAVKPLTRHQPATKNAYTRSGEFTKQKRAEKVQNARAYSKTGKHITDYQKPRFAKQRDLQIEEKAKKLNVPVDLIRSAVLGDVK